MADTSKTTPDWASDDASHAAAPDWSKNGGTPDWAGEKPATGGVGDFVSGAGAQLKRGVLHGLAGALPAAVGAAHVLGVASEERDKNVFDAARALREKADAGTPAPDSFAGKAGGLVGGLGAGILTAGAGEAGGRGMDVIDAGGDVGQARKAAGISGAAAVGGLAIPGLGKGIAQRVVAQGAASGVLGEGAREAENAVLPESMHRDFDPVDAALSVGIGAAGGLIPHAKVPEAAPHEPPGLTPEIAAQAADLTRGVDARTGAPQQPALPPGQPADFVVGANGETMSPDQARARAAGGAGMEQQAPGGPPPPVVAPAPPAGPLARTAAAVAPQPLAIAHEPGFVAGPDGVAVNRYDGQVERKPGSGGPGMDEPVPMDSRAPAQSGALKPPAGPLSAAADIGGLRRPPEAPAAELPPPVPQAPSGTAGAKPAPLEQYAAREQQIEALNTKRKAGALTAEENDQLHELRDQQDLVNPVSGIPNRKALDRAMASGQFTHAVAMDVDGFKAINDNFGHKVGDLVLQKLGQRLADESNGNILFTHNSGDEYAAAAKGDPTAHVAALQDSLAKTPFTVEYVDGEGKPVQHTFNGLGLTFGVGKRLDEADLAANASKEQRAAAGLRRRREDTRPQSDAGQLQTPEGSPAPVGEDGRRNDLQRTAAGGADEPVNAAHAAPVGGSETAAVASGGHTAAGSGDAPGGVVPHGANDRFNELDAHGVPAWVRTDARKNPEFFGIPPSKYGNVLDFAAHSGGLNREAFRKEFGVDPATWRTRDAQRSNMRSFGKPLFRKEGGLTPDDLREKLQEHGWLNADDPNAPPKYSTSDAFDLIDRAIRGDSVIHPADADFEAHARDIERQQQEFARDHQTAKERGFDSIEAMHEHDAANFVHAEDFDGSPREDIPFSAGGRGGMRRENLQAAIAKTVRGWQGDAPGVKVHQSHDEAPPFLRNARGFDNSVEGAYDPHTGTVHLFADAIKSPQRAMQVLAHEAIGHYGAEGVLGKDWGKFVSDLTVMRKSAPKSMRDVFTEVERRYPGASDETFAAETLAVMAEKGIRNAFMDRVLATVRQFLRSIGLNVKFSDAELRQMLVAAQRRVEGERFQRGASAQPAAAFSKREGGAASGDMFGGATSRDHVDAAVRAKDEQLRGGGKAPTMLQGDGDLFAGPRPEQTHIETAARESAAHPENPRAEPTPAQHEAGNFKMGHAKVGGMDVTIEVPKGGARRGTDASGKEWSRPVSDHYGYIKRSEGADGEQVDVYLGQHAHEHGAKVFVIDQVKNGTSKFDEHKAMIGYESAKAARASYERNFPADFKTFGGIREMPIGEFKDWVRNGDTTKPAAKAQQALFSKADKIDSPEFQRYFAGSKVVGKDGAPRVVFHGTGEDFNVFDHTKAGEATQHATSPLGHFFSEDRNLAERYAANASEGVPANERVVDAYLAIKKPYEMKLSEAQAIDTPAEARAVRARLEAKGYDGVHIAEAKSWIAFESAQAKSASGNRGTFDRANPDIRFSKADAAGGAKESEPSFVDRATGVFRPGAAEQAANALKKVALNARDLARGVSRAAWAARDRAVGTADAAIDAFRTHFDARPKDVRADPLKSYDSVIAYQQKRPIADPVERNFIGTMAKMLDAQATAIRAFGEDKLGLLDQYFPQLWKDPGRAEKMYADMQAKRPLAGAKGFTKERVFADYEQGIKAGMEPAYDNPADALMARYQSGERYLSALKIRDGIDRLGLLQDLAPGDRVPQGFARVNDNTFAGKVVPELVAKDLNNYLAPGLGQFTAWRNFRWMQNALLSARLGFSAFHAGFTTVDSAMTHLDLGMRRALSGDIAAAVKHLAQVPLTPFKALQGLAGKGEGAKLVRQFYGKDAIDDPHTAAVLHALTEGGARGRMDPTDYNNDFAQTLRAFRTDGAAALAKTPLRTFGAVLEGVMRPIAHNLVPAQKMTARVDLMKYELDRVAAKLGKDKGDYAGIVKAMGDDALRQIAGDVVQRVDDRLGQLAYDNLFWNRTVKDILQASIQSVGWNVGTKNVIFGGLGDVRKIFKPDQLLAPLDKAGKVTDAQMSRVTGRLSYLVALNLGIGTMGAVTQYLLTGKGPEELRDYFFPKTGNKNPDGSDARISFPSYVKDEFGFARHPIDTVQHKLHPSFGMVAELLNNKDFYGNEVFNPDDPWTKVATQIAGHVAKGFVPYAVQNQDNVAAAGGGVGARIAPFVGVTPAPGDITHSDFQNYVSEKYFAAHPTGGKSPEEADRSHAFMQAANAMRRGEKPDLTGFTPKERASLQRYVQHDPVETHFAKLNLEQKLHAYDRASEAERTQYNLRQKILGSKWSRELEQEPDTDAREQLRARVQDLMQK